MIDPLSITFAALSDPTRRAILARLALGETSVKELSEPFAISPPSITKHLKVLERAGLIRRSREAQWRPCRLEPAPLKDVSEWVERYRASWEQSLNRLDNYLSTLEAAPISNEPASKKPALNKPNLKKEKKKHVRNRTS
jgi:DNA-binding transcriptional ArsR family regulator